MNLQYKTLLFGTILVIAGILSASDSYAQSTTLDEALSYTLSREGKFEVLVKLPRNVKASNCLVTLYGRVVEENAGPVIYTGRLAKKYGSSRSQTVRFISYRIPLVAISETNPELNIGATVACKGGRSYKTNVFARELACVGGRLKVGQWFGYVRRFTS